MEQQQYEALPEFPFVSQSQLEFGFESQFPKGFASASASASQSQFGLELGLE